MPLWPVERWPEPSVHDDQGLDGVVAVEDATARVAGFEDFQVAVHVALVADIDRVVVVAGLEVQVEGPFRWRCERRRRGCRGRR